MLGLKFNDYYFRLHILNILQQLMDYWTCSLLRKPNPVFPNRKRKWHWADTIIGSLNTRYAVPEKGSQFQRRSLKLISQRPLNPARDKILYPRVSATVESIKGSPSYTYITPFPCYCLYLIPSYDQILIYQIRFKYLTRSLSLITRLKISQFFRFFFLYLQFNKKNQDLHKYAFITERVKLINGTNPLINLSFHYSYQPLQSVFNKSSETFCQKVGGSAIWQPESCQDRFITLKMKRSPFP